MLPTSVSTSRRGRVEPQRQRRLVRQQLLEHARRRMIEDQQRVAGDRPRENLMDGRDSDRRPRREARSSTPKSDGRRPPAPRARRDGRSAGTATAAARPKPMFRSSMRASCWTCVSSIRRDLSPRLSTISRNGPGSIGLLRKPAAPAACDQLARRRLDVGGHDDDTGRRIELAKLGQHVEPVHALHHEVEQDDVRAARGSSARAPTGRPRPRRRRSRRLRGCDGCCGARAPNRRRAAPSRSYPLHDRLGELIERDCSSLSPASTTERGMPYTTQVSSASVRIQPPCALIHAAPSRPSLPMPVMTTPSIRAP